MDCNVSSSSMIATNMIYPMATIEEDMDEINPEKIQSNEQGKYD